MPNELETRDGNIYGTWHTARNWNAEMGDTVHGDELAKRMGQRGGMIVGWYHLDLFTKLILETFGQQWFERGSLSIFFTYALIDGDQVRAVMGVPTAGATDTQVMAWAETPEGKTVCTGTASVGEPQAHSYLMAMDLKSAERGDIRILYDINAGNPMPTMDVVIEPEMVESRLAHIHDPLDWYKGESPWGEPILPMSLCYEALCGGDPNTRIGVDEHRAAGFMGAEEIRNINGPIKQGVKYRTGGTYLAVGNSPKTEFFWYDSWLDEAESGKRVAEMRHMWRYFKADSPLWQET